MSVVTTSRRRIIAISIEIKPRAFARFGLDRYFSYSLEPAQFRATRDSMPATQGFTWMKTTSSELKMEPYDEILAATLRKEAPSWPFLPDCRFNHEFLWRCGYHGIVALL